ncbi:MAG: sulfotransferase [Ketobacter sp.]
MKKTKKADKNARKSVHVSLPGRPGAKILPAAEAVAFARQLSHQQQWAVTAVMMQQITDQVPGFEDAWLVWFEACHGMGDFGALARVATRCLNHKPRFVPALIALSTALRFNQRHDEARALIEKALKLEPANAGVLNHLGILLKETGELQAALETFNRCIRIQPESGEAYWNRSDLLHSPSDQDIGEMLGLLERSGLSDADRIRLHYALSRAYEFRAEFDQQFDQIAAGADLKRSTAQYDHGHEMAQLRRIPDCFNNTIWQAPSQAQGMSAATDRSAGAGLCTPVFICGLPRSGTTLVEQILSSHDRVVAGDELNALPLATARLLKQKGIRKAFPEWVGELTDGEWQQIGAFYLEQTESLQQKGFFTDKNLQNYKAVGLIRRALPQAKIIYCTRNPMDTLWSCYRQLFGDGLLFTYSQTELADTWNAANKLMQFWQQQLTDRIFVVEHEQLLADQESVTRSLLEFVGLEWSENCLQFHQNPRAVKTVSALQVRQPLDQHRGGQWKRYQDRLQPMLQALDFNDDEAELNNPVSDKPNMEN